MSKTLMEVLEPFHDNDDFVIVIDTDATPLMNTLREHMMIKEQTVFETPMRTWVIGMTMFQQGYIH